jgi:hypothetical protein
VLFLRRGPDERVCRLPISEYRDRLYQEIIKTKKEILVRKRTAAAAARPAGR